MSSFLKFNLFHSISLDFDMPNTSFVRMAFIWAIWYELYKSLSVHTGVIQELIKHFFPKYRILWPLMTSLKLQISLSVWNYGSFLFYLVTLWRHEAGDDIQDLYLLNIFDKRTLPAKNLITHQWTVPPFCTTRICSKKMCEIYEFMVLLVWWWWLFFNSI